MTVSARNRAEARWSHRERVAEFGHPCAFCRRGFRTERGQVQHQRRCQKNPEAPMFTSGAYDPILNAAGAVVGFISNGRNEHERRRIRASMASVGAAIGLPTHRFGKSHREVVLGPDPAEPCAVCPESRERHAEMVGACQLPGCRCSAFVGAVGGDPQVTEDGR